MQKDIYKSDYFYELPEDLIAKYPTKDRTSSKLLHLDKKNIHIDKFTSIKDVFEDGDLLVLNETKVISRIRYFEIIVTTNILTFNSGSCYRSMLWKRLTFRSMHEICYFTN